MQSDELSRISSQLEDTAKKLLDRQIESVKAQAAHEHLAEQFAELKQQHNDTHERLKRLEKLAMIVTGAFMVVAFLWDAFKAKFLK